MSGWGEYASVGVAAGSILLATLGWIYTALENRRLSRRSHTFDVLLNTDITGDFAELLDEIDDRARGGQPVGLDGFDAKLRRVLNFHEFVCAAIRNRTLDEGLIRSTLRSRTLRLYDYSRELIREIRETRANPEALEHLEWFAEKRLGYAHWKRGRAGAAWRTGDPHG